MNTDIINTVQKTQLQDRPDMQVGDTVKLHMRITEGEKSRIQIFEGIVLAIKGSGMDQTVTVRKISFGVGVEKIVPVHSPTLEKIEVVKRGKVRQSKIYYMRDRIGRKAMKIKGSELMPIDDQKVVEKEQELSDQTEAQDQAEVVAEEVGSTSDTSSQEPVSEE